MLISFSCSNWKTNQINNTPFENKPSYSVVSERFSFKCRSLRKIENPAVLAFWEMWMFCGFIFKKLYMRHSCICILKQ